LRKPPLDMQEANADNIN